MQLPSDFHYIVLTSFFAIAAIYLIKGNHQERQLLEASLHTGDAFQEKPFLTENELEFLHRMELAMPEIRFHAQVSMGALINPAATKGDKDFNRLRRKFAQKIVDFVAQDRRSGRVIAIIELDDKTHDPLKDAQRDAMTADAGYITIRWDSRAKPSIDEIRRTLGSIMPDGFQSAAA